MKKILVYGFTYNMGGVETFYMNYYRKLNKQEYQIDFIKYYDKIAFEDELVSNGSRMYQVSHYNKHPIRFYRELVEIFKNGKYDVFHANMSIATNIAHLIAAKKCGVKTIIAHSHTSSCNRTDSIIKKVFHYFNKSLIKFYANKLIACSKPASKWLFGRKTAIFPNAIDLEKFSFDEEVRKELREELKIKKDTFVIGHIGRFDKQKNHKFLIEIFSEVHKQNEDTVLLLIGQGTLEEEIKKQVKELKLEKKVIFLGKRDDIERLYQVFDIFVLPSIYEGLPLVGIEAQANGLPCVFSNQITDEIKLNSNVYFLGIEEENLNSWKSKILEEKEVNRCTDLKKLYDCYNINSAVEKLKKLYE